jgi:single-strand DNA-binding protein
MLNKYIAIGNLTIDPSIKKIKDTSLCTFSLAINNPVKKDDVCFIDVEAWGRTADNCEKFLSKGSKIFMEGRLKYGCWEAKDGSKRCKVSCVADYVQFMSTKGEGEGVKSVEESPPAEPESTNTDEFDELSDIPF